MEKMRGVEESGFWWFCFTSFPPPQRASADTELLSKPLPSYPIPLPVLKEF